MAAHHGKCVTPVVENPNDEVTSSALRSQNDHQKGETATAHFNTKLSVSGGDQPAFLHYADANELGRNEFPNKMRSICLLLLSWQPLLFSCMPFPCLHLSVS